MIPGRASRKPEPSYPANIHDGSLKSRTEMAEWLFGFRSTYHVGRPPCSRITRQTFFDFVELKPILLNPIVLDLRNQEQK